VNPAQLSAREAAEAYGLLRWAFLPLDPRSFGVLTSKEYARDVGKLEKMLAAWPGVSEGEGVAAAGALANRAEFEALYHATFRGNMVISPFETDYTASHAFEQARDLADIGGFYRAFGLNAAKSGVDRSDHVAAELEYLCVLAWHEAEGKEAGDADRVEVARKARDEFLREHAGRWFEEFAKRCQQRDAPALFAATASLAAALVGEQLKAVGAKPRPPAPPSLPLADAP
jgi:TorA maturation chaperone TorD